MNYQYTFLVQLLNLTLCRSVYLCVIFVSFLNTFIKSFLDFLCIFFKNNDIIKLNNKKKKYIL